MRTRAVLFLLTVALLVAVASPAGASPGICIPQGDPHKPPLCIT